MAGRRHNHRRAPNRQAAKAHDGLRSRDGSVRSHCRGGFLKLVSLAHGWPVSPVSDVTRIPVERIIPDVRASDDFHGALGSIVAMRSPGRDDKTVRLVKLRANGTTHHPARKARAKRNPTRKRGRNCSKPMSKRGQICPVPCLRVGLPGHLRGNAHDETTKRRIASLLPAAEL